MVNFDLDQKEIEHLTAALDLSGQSILEIGCGDGRLTK